MVDIKNGFRNESSRLINWDYRSSSYYFLTICTKDKRQFFGKIEPNGFEASQIGLLAKKYWQEIPICSPSVQLDEFVIMPDHFHGILFLKNKWFNNIRKEDQNGPYLGPPKLSMSKISPKKGSVSAIIRSYKSIVTKSARLINPDFQWQPRFHDVVIKDDQELQIEKKIYK